MYQLNKFSPWPHTQYLWVSQLMTTLSLEKNVSINPNTNSTVNSILNMTGHIANTRKMQKIFRYGCEHFWLLNTTSCEKPGLCKTGSSNEPVFEQKTVSLENRCRAEMCDDTMVVLNMVDGIIVLLKVRSWIIQCFDMQALLPLNDVKVLI